MTTNAISWFEIPAADFRRATQFYETIFQITTILEDVDPPRIKSIFPVDSGVTGAIAYGPDWTPSAHGVVIYLNAGDDLGLVLDRVEGAGGTVVEPKQLIGINEVYWGRFSDTEGNLIGLLSPH